MSPEKILFLQKKAMEIRLTGLEMVQNARSGHIGGAFSLAEIMSILYFEKMNIDPERPDWEDRDRFVLSKGHATVALYPTLALRGFFPKEELNMFRRLEGHMSGHAEMHHIRGVDMSTGSLGQGFSVALGMALGGKLAGKDYYCYAVLGDGEIQEGQIWEACMSASKYRLNHLIAILDSNKVQLDGTVSEIMDTGDLRKKFESFGFYVQSVDGHSVEQVAEAVENAKNNYEKPSMIIANTVKGKGVSFMEGKSEWHGKTPDDVQFAAAFKELREKYAKLEAEV